MLLIHEIIFWLSLKLRHWHVFSFLIKALSESDYNLDLLGISLLTNCQFFARTW